MAVIWYPDADDAVDLPLAADPDVVGANSVAALARYHAVGDASALVVPDGATFIKVKPLTASQLAACGTKAGAAPALGIILSDEAGAAGDDAYQAAWKAAEAALSAAERAMLDAWRDGGMDESHEGAEVGQRVATDAAQASTKARAGYVDGLDAGQRASLVGYQEWTRRRDEEVLRAGWLSVSNWHGAVQADLVPTLDKVRPLSVQQETRAEIVRHILRVSTMPPMGKACFDSQSGALTRSPCTPGPASRVQNTSNGAPAETADAEVSAVA